MPIKTFVAINDYIYAENNNIIVKYVTLCTWLQRWRLHVGRPFIMSCTYKTFCHLSNSIYSSINYYDRTNNEN